jgi:hypothetical protein
MGTAVNNWYHTELAVKQGRYSASCEGMNFVARCQVETVRSLLVSNEI